MSETATVNLVDLDGRWQQFDIACSLISAPQWLHIDPVVDCRGFTGSAKDRL